jgi:hypothetical protein
MLENEENHEEIERLFTEMRKHRDTNLFNNPMYPNVLGTDELSVYLETTYIFDKGRWN